jgi:hypothetical protein
MVPAMSWLLQLLKVPTWLVLVGLVLVALAAFVGLAQAMRSPVLPDTAVVEFEFVWTPERAESLLAKWTPEQREAMRRALLLDFPFILAYGVLLSGLVLMAARGSTGWFQSLGLGLVLMPLLAGLLDAFENLCLLRLLDLTGRPGPLLTGLAGILATTKFALLGGCVLYVLVGGAPALWTLVRSKLGSG